MFLISSCSCKVENVYVVGAAQTVDTPTTSEWPTILLPKVWLILEVWQYSSKYQPCVTNNFIATKVWLILEGWQYSSKYQPELNDRGLRWWQVNIGWCRQATSHYLSQCWSASMLPYGITRPQWVKETCTKMSNILQMTFSTMYFVTKNFVLIKISFQVVSGGSALVQVTAWSLTYDKPLPEPMMT